MFVLCYQDWLYGVIKNTVKQEIFTTGNFHEIARSGVSRQENFANIRVQEIFANLPKSRNSRNFPARENFLFYSILCHIHVCKADELSNCSDRKNELTHSRRFRKSNVYATLAIIPRTKEINKTF